MTSLICVLIFSIIGFVSAYYNASLIILNPELALHCVYFIYIPPDPLPFKEKISNQLVDLVHSGLYSQLKSFHIIISTYNIIHGNDQSNLGNIARELKINTTVNIIERICPTASIQIFRINEVEYRGILQVWKIAQTLHDDLVIPKKHLILYFHTKGMTSGDDHNTRHFTEKLMFKYVIHQWKRAVSYFDKYPSVNKVGIQATDHGWIWGNFWWTRASYIKTLECPRQYYIRSNDRFYYEHWLSKYEKLKLNLQIKKERLWYLKTPIENAIVSLYDKDYASLCPTDLPNDGVGVWFSTRRRSEWSRRYDTPWRKAVNRLPCFHGETLPDPRSGAAPYKYIYGDANYIDYNE